jgi:hypothetical protein
VDVLQGVDDLDGQGAGQRRRQGVKAVLESFIQINSKPEIQKGQTDMSAKQKKQKI